MAWQIWSLRSKRKKKRLQILGHEIRIDNARVEKNLCKYKLDGRKEDGRPWLRWLEDFEEDTSLYKSYEHQEMEAESQKR